MPSDEHVRRFASLFAGNPNAYGTDRGGCVRQPVTSDVWQGHLAGGEPIGIYPIDPATNTVRWGCVDIDFDDLELAVALKTCIGYFVGAWIERSRSKGYHVWVFASDPIPAATMRRALLAACQIIGYTPKEVNPKQESLAFDQLGNYVRLPYPWGAPYGRQVMLNPTVGAIDVTHFLALVKPAQPANFAALAALYVEPPKPAPIIPAAQTDTLTDKLDGLAWTVYQDGPLEGSDRSGTLVKLAHGCHRSGLTSGEAFTIVCDADARWGKYAHRADRDEQLTKIVQAAYG